MVPNDVNLKVTKDVDRNSIKILEIKAIKFAKGSETYQFRDSYKSDKWTVANIRVGRMVIEI